MQSAPGPGRRSRHLCLGRLAPLVLAAALPIVSTVSAPARAAVPDAQFAPVRSYPVPSGLGVQSVAIGDFTGDGRDDVVANTVSGHDPARAKLFVYAQTPAGELEERASLALSSHPRWAEGPLAAGDLDEDGRLDVVVPTGTGIDLFFQDDGGLGGRTTVAMPGPGQVEITDVDGDGHADVVANGEGGVSWLRGAGDGTFGAPILIAPVTQVEIAVGDVTGDGRPDVIGFANFDADMHLFRQRADGTFAATNFDSLSHSGLAIGDVTGDGRADFVQSINATEPAGGIFVLPQRADHSLGPAAIYESFDNPGPIKIDDFNGDGRLDVATLHASYPFQWAGVHLQDTDGTLTPERRVRIGSSNSVSYTRQALDTGDVTGDGRPDMVWADAGAIFVVRALEPPPPSTTTSTTPSSSTSTSSTTPSSTTSSTTPGSTTSTSAPTTTTTTVPPPPGPGESTSFQIDAAHSGRLAGGAAPPLEKRWTRDLGGPVSYPLVAEGKVFALASHAPTLGSTLYALDAATGEDLWGPLDLGNDAWIAYGDGQVFVLNKDGVRRSLDAATGALRWIDRPAVSTTIDTPPVYEDGVLWYHAKGNYVAGLVKVSATDGKEIAQLQAQVGGDSVPAVFNGLVYSSHRCSPTRAFDSRTGAAVWTYGQWCTGSEANFTPVVAEGIVWARAAANRPPTAIDAVTGAMVVYFATDAAPAFDGGRGYFLSHGVLEARNPRSQAPLWSFAGDGQLKVAPIVVHGYVYVTSTSGQIWALDGETGEVAWTGDAGAPILPPSEVDDLPQLIGLAAGQGLIVVPATNLLVAFGSEGESAATVASPGPAQPSALPAAFTSSGDGPPSDEATTVRIDAAHQSRAVGGRESAPLRKTWARDLGFPVRYSLLAEGKVFAAAGSSLFALDGVTGVDAWGPISLGPTDSSSRSYVGYGDGRVFAAHANGPLRAFDAATGAELWSMDLRLYEDLRIPPVYAEGLLYIVTHVGGLQAISAATGREVWRGDLLGGGVQLPTISDGRIYWAGGCSTVAFDAYTGALLWNVGGLCSDSTSTASAVAYGRIWNEGTGRETPVTLDAATGKLVGVFGGTLPAFDAERYFTLHGNVLKAKDPETHFTEWTFVGDGGLGTPPVVIDGLVYIGSQSGRVWALEPSTGVVVWEGDAGVPIVARGWQRASDLGANIAAGQGLVVVPATNTLVAFEPVTAPPPAPESLPSAWGWNPFGQVGDGSGVDRLSPVTMAGLTDVVEVAAGGYHSLSVRADATVWASGWNALGLLGDGTTVSRTTAVQVPGLTDVVSVATGLFHSLALKRDGSVWAWGWNGVGQVGDGSVTQRNAPVQVAGLSDIVGVSAGMYHSLAVKRDGTVWSWGWNGYGQLGDGGTVDQPTPVRARGLTDAVSVAGGGFHSLAVKRDGTAVGWGWNAFGQLGDNSNVDRRTPTPIAGLAHVTGLAAGFYHGAAVHDDGTVSGWGWNGVGQVGDGTLTWRWAPVKLPGLQGVTAVSAGYYNSVARTEDGRVLGWGWNGVGQLGDGTTTTRLTPQPVPSLYDVRKVSAGSLHTVAI